MSWQWMVVSGSVAVIAIYGLCIFYHWLYWNGDILQAKKKKDGE